MYPKSGSTALPSWYLATLHCSKKGKVNLGYAVNYSWQFSRYINLTNR